MAYSTPKTWQHGDTVAHTDMQKYSDGLNAIHPMLGDDKIRFAQFYSNFGDTQRHYIVHRCKWLITRSTGEIRHPTQPDVYKTVSLSDADTFNVIEVDASVDWIVPGVLYEVRGCSVAFEDDEGIIA